MKTLFFNTFAGVLIGIALATALLPPSRFAYFDDSITCGLKATTQYDYSFLSYYFLSQPVAGNQVKIGTCPYENYYVKSYSMDLWALAIIIIVAANWRRLKTAT